MEQVPILQTVGFARLQELADVLHHGDPAPLFAHLLHGPRLQRVHQAAMYVESGSEKARISLRGNNVVVLSWGRAMACCPVSYRLG